MTRLRENNAASGIGVFATYSYTPTGQRAAVTYGNGTSRSYAYDTAGRTTGVKLDLAGAEHDLVIGAVAGAGTPVSYNPAGQIVSLSRSNDLYAWTAHSLFERDYAVNGINQYTSAGGVALGHDGRGNLTASGSSTYGYSRLNELTSAPNPIGGTIQLTYDPKGRLTQVNPGTPVRMVYAGPNLVTEVSAAGTILRRYVHGPGNDEPIVWYEGAGTTDRRWLQADQLGSVAAISNATGTSLGINRYDEYGIPQTGNLGRFQYTGQTWWGELGLYNYKARWYSATLGRFMQTDPIGYKDQLNLYAYVGNDPVNGTDPTGLRGGTPSDGCDPQAARVSMACGGTITTTSGERQNVSKKTEAGVNAYWASRCKKGDPVGCLAPNYDSNSTAEFPASFSRRRLESALGGRHTIRTGRVWTSDGYVDRFAINRRAFDREYLQIRVELADAHMRAVDSDQSGVIGLLSPDQIAEYHIRVFANHGLPASTYGGAMLGARSVGMLSYHFCDAGFRGCDAQ